VKVVILSGGFGTRLGETTKKTLKPLVKIGGRPIITHIMNHYKKYGYKKFIVLSGYKHSIVKEYFKNNKDVKVIYTGLKTFTGGRLKRIKKIFKKKEDFFLTYGDAVSNVNLNLLKNLHKKNKALVTVTAVNPDTKYGLLEIKGRKVTKFTEKPKFFDKWINGGFFIMNEKLINFIKNDQTILEKKPLELAAKRKKFIAYKHNKFWACMDTQRDLKYLKNYWKKNKRFS